MGDSVRHEKQGSSPRTAATPRVLRVFIMITSVCNLPRRKGGLEAPTPEEDEMTTLFFLKIKI
ncbi:hypothetical protein I7I50_06910 [Histoplasma capsulatum G186AR]|uniref:Uncharacterized protein n=1 Tax=Ajellomyces capsulatus TaxID=5037 RepID=A0A8H7Z1Y9_AJECA|nr:hypothetical protein I7I52_10016 [Histoplasma capsulatum]QSS67735.1 hypothetical protein I7I50_06910 [Histoplasma capsulatum G186AR]